MRRRPKKEKKKRRKNKRKSTCGHCRAGTTGSNRGPWTNTTNPTKKRNAKTKKITIKIPIINTFFKEEEREKE